MSLKRNLKSRIHAAFHKIRGALNTSDHFSYYPETLISRHSDEKVSQISLMQQYRSVAATNKPALLKFSDAGFRKYSQNEEDGLLLYIFSLIGTTNKKCVEICVADGTECNTANLIINHGWWGLMFDGGAENIARANEYYANHRDAFIYPPVIKQGWMTAENVNDLIGGAGFNGEIDLLSIDVDGNDYWIWKAITVVRPRVVVIEYQNPIPPVLALTVPYNAKFCVKSFDDDFRGASLLAMTHLGRTNGYRLVGTNRFGYNAFFVRNGLADDAMPEVTPESCAMDPYTLQAQQIRWPRVKDKPWLEV